MLCNHLEHMQPSHVPEASCPDTTRQGDRNREKGNQHLRHVAHIWGQSLRAQQYIILRWSHGQVTKVSQPGPAHYYRVFCRHSVQDDAGQGLSPHPETEASGNHKKMRLRKSMNYLMRIYLKSVYFLCNSFSLRFSEKVSKQTLDGNTC